MKGMGRGIHKHTHIHNKKEIIGGFGSDQAMVASWPSGSARLVWVSLW